MKISLLFGSFKVERLETSRNSLVYRVFDLYNIQIPQRDTPRTIWERALMTENNLIEEIEEFLALTANRQQFTAQEIQDLLLDLRNIAEHDSCVSIAASILQEKEIANPAGGTT